MTLPTHTDEDLVKKSLQNKEFFGMLVERYEAPLSRYIKRLGVRDNDDVVDVLQEVFIKTYRNLNDFDVTLSFSSWVYRIAHNETMSWFRKRQVRPEGHLIEDSDAVLLLVESTEAEHEELFDQAVDAERVRHALDDLDPKYRDVIILRYFEHKEYEEISDILKIPTGSVGTLIFRAKKRLKQLLENEEIGS